MSIQTFSKSFLFSNNKEKLKIKLPIATGPARGNQLAHGHTWPAQTERRGCGGLAGASAHGHLAQLGRGEVAMPASRRHGGAALPAGQLKGPYLVLIIE